MYKILIVDDEIFVRMGLKLSIDWESNGFTVIGEASSGTEALEKIQSNVPDIVITDIKMPGMDGVQLIKALSEKYPAVKCIVLSNYNEFELVKEAMKFGAVDYFLKVTIEPEKLIALLHKICAETDNEKSIMNDLSELRQTLRHHRTVIDNKFYLDLIKPGLNEEAVRSKVKALELDLYDDQGHILLLMLSDYERLSADRFRSDRDLLTFTILNVAEELINDQSSGKIIECSPGAYAIIVSFKEQADKRAVHSLALRIYTTIHDYLSMESIVVIGQPFRGGVQLREGLLQLEQMKFLAFYAPTGVVSIEQHTGKLTEQWSAQQQGSSVEDIHRAYMDIRKQIVQFIKLGTGELIPPILSGFLDNCREHQIDPTTVKRYAISIAHLIQDELIMQDANASGSLTDKLERVMKQVDSSFNITELKEVCGAFVREYAAWIGKLGHPPIREEVAKAIDYIRRRYHERVTLEDVAEYISMNKSYFSRLFKQETGEMFHEYLIRTRMEQAQELLLSSDAKISDIAIEVGYNDIFYFNRAFKAYAGMPPSEYRNKIQSKG
ncbi:response regulator transcription factor [Paenibacillus sp. IITD108]|uniref:response regulator transcription factor n=1 Tax=Paenibacillus sp. IITD108 TaxID=3116649 RepID=UPI002F3FE88F